MVRGRFEPAILQVAGFLAAYSASELLTALLTIFEELVLRTCCAARAPTPGRFAHAQNPAAPTEHLCLISVTERHISRGRRTRRS